ncbi:siderophore-interacting protein [Actinoplanes sp. LDG1-06]|uniref:Siderophore-interacting protein n=1 Tax=Paractinoplanes ovalisporus TaxID=2810368 RepID=A0ABS2ACD7_9ACTN|nr:siderophore-interacting protein [Actinoplanes ovalisporus]MBM2617486.1 siderophore-interacting protein [Actinoplanes ovalisporus]
MARGWEGAVIKVLGGRDHVLTVTGRREIAPHFVRLSFEAPTLFSKVRPEPAAWLRFWIPDPDGGKREYQRAYTIAEADETAGTIEVDFVLHEPAGPASLWATKVEPGSQVAVVSLGSQPFKLADEVSGVMLVADAASVPAVNGILRTLPAGVDVELVLEQAHAEDEQIPLVGRPGLTVHRVPRQGTDSLVKAVSERIRPGWQFWAAGESGSLKAVRAVARGRAGATKENTYTQAYWIEGKAMGKRRDDNGS